GLELGRHFVKQGWRAYYWNRDVNREPSNMIKKKIDQPYELVKKTKEYYGIKISGFVINYLPLVEWDRTTDAFLPQKTHSTSPELALFERLKAVPFAVMIMSAGWHTFLLSEGIMYEAHRDKIGLDVWGVKPFEKSESYHGVLLIPPSINFNTD